MLWGHGYFRKYVHRITAYCLYAEGEVIDNAEYTVFECARWQSYRSELTYTNGTIAAAYIVGVLIMSGENWALVVNYVEGILRLNSGLDDNGTRVRRYTKQGRGRKE